MLGSWLTCIGRVERNLIIVGLLLLFQHFSVLVMTLILRKKQILSLCRLYSGVILAAVLNVAAA